MNELKNEKRLIIGVFVLEMPIIYLPISLLNFNSNCFEIRLLFLIISIETKLVLLIALEISPNSFIL